MKLFLLIFLLSFCAISQEIIEEDVDTDLIGFERIKQERLVRIRGELVSLQNDIYETKQSLKTSSDSVEKFKLEVKLTKLLKEELDKRTEFIETATNINIKIHTEELKKDKSSLSDNIQAVLQPAFDGLRAISERPRKIQDLKDKEEQFKSDLDNIQSALNQLKNKLAQNKDSVLQATYRKSILLTESELKKVEILLEDVRFKLLKLENDKGSIVTSFSKAIFEFLKTKGKNLLFAIIIFIAIFWVFRLGKNKFLALVLSRAHKKADPAAQINWIVRPIRVIYSVISIILALSMGILTLYVLDDWVLVTIIIFVISSVIWSSRTYLPNFIELSKIVLNLGAIREGERIIFNNLAWQIKSLGYYTRLVNPVLKGGALRVNTKELITLHSRPINENEPWFPTKSSDWVILKDGIYGKVVMQSAEQVIIKLIGGQSKFYKTSEFLELAPINLSNDFGIELIFGVDYDHQSKVTDELTSLFKTEFANRIDSYLSGLKEDFKDINVEFHSAGDNSLNFRFFLRCNGNLASQKSFIERRVNTIFVEICNENNLTIPFAQLKVHMSKNE